MPQHWQKLATDYKRWSQSAAVTVKWQNMCWTVTALMISDHGRGWMGGKM